MKKARLVIAMVLVAMMASMFSFASADAVVDVTADKTEVSVGDTVTVSFTIPADTYMALDMYATWDATELEYVEGSAVMGTCFDLNVAYGAKRFTGVGNLASQLNLETAKAGTVFSAKFKVLKANATISGEIVEAVDAQENVFEPTVATLQFTEYVAPTTTEPTTTEPTTTEPTTTEPTTAEPTTTEPTAAEETTTVAEETTTVAEETTTVAEETTAAAETDTDVETDTNVETDTDTDSATKDNPKTGVVACAAAVVALAASGAVLVKSKRK